MKIRIWPDVFDSAYWIACTMRSCSSLLRNSFVRIELPARARAAAAKTSAAAAKSATASGRPASSSTAHRKEHGAASPRGIGITAAPAHHSRNDRQHNDKNNEEQKAGRGVVGAPFLDCFASPFVFASNRFEDRIDPVDQPAFVIVVTKTRFDPVFGDVEGSQVRKRAL